MRNIFKRTAVIFLCIIILTSAFVFNASAAGTIISFSKKSLTVGDTVTVTVTLNPGEAMYSVGCVINYDNNVINYTSGNASGGAGSVSIIESPSGETKVSYSLTFTAMAAGSCTVSVIDCKYATLGNNGAEEKGLSGASATLTVNDAALSSNANLSALSLSAGTLSPRFSASRTSYTVAVKNSVTECKVFATAADSNAKVEVSGEATLKIGKNTRTVTVTAPSGAQKVYTITINRSETDEVTSSEETPSEPQENKLETSIEGITYTVATDISGVALFKGFTASTAQYNSEEVAVATDSDGNYKLYYLKAPDSDALTPYTYDEENNLFIKLSYFTQGENSYIYADIPEGKTLADEYYTTNATINGNEVTCYGKSSSPADFYYIYCFADGHYGFYRYDSRENVMQRYPELELLDKEDLIVEDKPDNILSRFKTLTTNAKIIIISLVLVLLAAIALIVLVIIKIVSRKDIPDFDEDELIMDNSFDNITFTDVENNNTSVENEEVEADNEN